MSDIKPMSGAEELRRSSSPDSKSTSDEVGLPRPSSPEVAGVHPYGRGEALSSTNFKAAVSDPAPSSPRRTEHLLSRRRAASPAQARRPRYPSWPRRPEHLGSPRCPSRRATSPTQARRSRSVSSSVAGPSQVLAHQMSSDPAPSLPDLMAAGRDTYGAKASSIVDDMARFDLMAARLENFLENVQADTVSCGDEAPKPLLEELIKSWEQFDEDSEGEDGYFDVLVDKFITAAYTQGMNGVVANGPGQQEAATTPGASACGMEAWDVPQVAESEGGEAAVTSVAKRVIRMLNLERFTWKRQTTEDGPDGLRVLSDFKQQPIKDSCLQTATAAVMESNLRVQLNKDVLLSVDHLIDLSNAGRAKFPNEKGVKLLFLMAKEGALSEEDYKNPQSATSRDAVRYRIVKEWSYLVDNRAHMTHALHRLRTGGPLLGVIKISDNYDNCYKNGLVYKYDPALVDNDEKGNPISITHAVCVISFAIEGNMPFLECQDSNADRRSRSKGFLKIDVTSLSYLYSIVVG